MTRNMKDALFDEKIYHELAAIYAFKIYSQQPAGMKE